MNKKTFYNIGPLVVLIAVLISFGCGHSNDHSNAIGSSGPSGDGLKQEKPDGSPDIADGEVAVIIEGHKFVPAEISIRPGTKVTWVNRDEVPHTATSDSNSFSSKVLGKGDTFTKTFGDPGDHPYHCIPHPNMKGAVRVIR